MHLQFALDAPQRVTIPGNHQDIMLSSTMELLAAGDPDVADQFHDGFTEDGVYDEVEYGPDDSSPSSFSSPTYLKSSKLFTFSLLRGHYEAHQGTFTYEGGRLWWRVASPRPEFIDTIKAGAGRLGCVKVGHYKLPIMELKEMPTPRWSTQRNKFVCLTPLVVRDYSPPTKDTNYYCFRCRLKMTSVPKLCPRCSGDIITPEALYLTPDNPRFVEELKASVLRHYKAFHGHPVRDPSFRVELDPGYLIRKNVVRTTAFRQTRHVGVTCPLMLSGNPELIDMAYQSGMGSYCTTGFGMISALDRTV
jgi:CRISPR/Cas system endoribonuclease Cas6 (RAMP superfamily)